MKGERETSETSVQGRKSVISVSELIEDTSICNTSQSVSIASFQVEDKPSRHPHADEESLTEGEQSLRWIGGGEADRKCEVSTSSLDNSIKHHHNGVNIPQGLVVIEDGRQKNMCSISKHIGCNGPMRCACLRKDNDQFEAGMVSKERLVYLVCGEGNKMPYKIGPLLDHDSMDNLWEVEVSAEAKQWDCENTEEEMEDFNFSATSSSKGRGGGYEFIEQSSGEGALFRLQVAPNVKSAAIQTLITKIHPTEFRQFFSSKLIQRKASDEF